MVERLHKTVPKLRDALFLRQAQDKLLALLITVVLYRDFGPIWCWERQRIKKHEGARFAITLRRDRHFTPTA